MKIAYFDCQFGAAGDMLNAALLAAGLDEAAWRAELSKLKIDDSKFQLAVSDVMRCSLAAKKLDVLDESGTKLDKLYAQSVTGMPAHHDHEHGHHDHEHSHHDHEHIHDESDHLHAHGHRRLPDILHVIEHSGLRAGARSLASRIFHRLAEAESRVHGVRPDEIHFHEVGSVDSMVDIIGFSIGYDLLAIEKSYCSQIAIGSGLVRNEHGLFPVPGPATLYLLEAAGAIVAPSSIGFECLTPTGAAILCEIVSQWGHQPAMQQIDGIGYGAGTKDPIGWPNVCRVTLGIGTDTLCGGVRAPRFAVETLAVIEANLDDFNPQSLAFVVEKLLSAGALDAFVTPVLMKKGRAGHLLTVLCNLQDRLRYMEMILEQTSTIGVRWHAAERLVAHRAWQDIELGHGVVRVKIARDNRGAIVNLQPEFDDCARYAESNGLPVKDVLADALGRARDIASSNEQW